MVKLVSASVTVAAALLAVVSAADYRLLVEKPSCITMDQFNASFTQLCPVFPDAGAPFNATSYFVPGDYSGNNTATEALVFCTHHYTNGSTVAFTTELVQQLGGTLSTSS